MRERRPPRRQPRLVSRRCLQRILRRLGGGARVSGDVVEAIEQHITFLVVVDLVEACLDLRRETELRLVQRVRRRPVLKKPSNWTFVEGDDEGASQAQRPEVKHERSPEVA